MPPRYPISSVARKENNIVAVASGNALEPVLREAEGQLRSIREKLLLHRQLLKEHIEQLPEAASQRRQSEVELERCQKEHAQLLDAREVYRQKAVEAREESERVLATVAASVRILTKRELEEVRALTRPPNTVKRALGLVFCLLHPEEAAPDVPWEEKIVPILRRDDLVQRILAFPDGDHPLLMFPKVIELIEQNVSVDDTDVSATAERESEPVPRGSKRRSAKKIGRGGIAAAQAASKLLKRGQNVQHVNRAFKLPPVRFKRDSSAGGAHHGNQSAPSSISRGGIVTSTTSDSASSICAGCVSLSSLDVPATKEKLTIESVNYSSRAVGALFCWVLSQIKYARALEQAQFALNEDCFCVQGEARSLISAAVVAATHRFEADAESAFRDARRQVTALEASERQQEALVTDIRERLAQDRAKAVARVTRTARAPMMKLQPLARPLPSQEDSPPCKQWPKRDMEADVHWLWRRQPRV